MVQTTGKSQPGGERGGSCIQSHSFTNSLIAVTAAVNSTVPLMAVSILTAFCIRSFFPDHCGIPGIFLCTKVKQKE